ncbi:shikimate kinase [Bremerella sp. JC817]|uniref:shikimate kinase n=1 Tax=Bremerella sp. JC817 TaxID=3231756 RepID=UPI003457A2C3
MTAAAGSNVTLIGMPGSGKSTIGVVLAKRMNLQFVDTDLIIQTTQQRTLQQIMDADGFDKFCQIEESAVLTLDVEKHVIATGGSVCYGPDGMAHLKSLGKVVFLKTSLQTLEKRLSNMATRGIALKPGQTLEGLFHERNALYTQYADLTIDCDGLNVERISEQIEAGLAPPST